MDSGRIVKSCAMVAGATLLASLVAAGSGLAAPAGTATHDGPFGIYMGEPLSKLGPVSESGPGFYQVLKPPKPNVLFKTFEVKVFPSTGVCYIAATTAHFDSDDVNGVQAIQMADQLADTLKTKYGAFTKVDECTADQQTCDNSWASALLGGQARYGYRWDLTATPRDDKIGLIGVAISGNTGSLFAGVAYFNVQRDACDAAERALTASSL